MLAMINWFLLPMLESLVIRGALISVRSMAMSPVLLVVVIFNCRRGRETVRTERQRSGREESSKKRN